MDSATPYTTLIKTILQEHEAIGRYDLSQPIVTHFIYDDDNAEYLMINVGWNTVWEEYVYGVVFHAWVAEGTVWIARDNVSPSMVGELITRGIPQEHILSAEQQPFIREATAMEVGQPA